MAKQKIRIHVSGGQEIDFIIRTFDGEVDLERLMKIDYSNLVGEIVTFPVIMTRLGVLLAEAKSDVQKAKLELDIYKSRTRKKIRDEIVKKGGKWTDARVDDELTLDAGYKAKQLSHISKQKAEENLTSLFWSAKDKSGKLDKLSLTIKADEVDTYMIDRVINGVEVKVR